MNLEPTLLIVEDDALLRSRLKDLFTQSGHYPGIARFRVTTAGSAEAASRQLRRARSRHTPFDVLLLDLSLPEKDDSPPGTDDPKFGLRILRRQADERACSAVVVATGYHYRRDVLIDLIRSRTAVGFVKKPWSPGHREVINGVLRAYFRGQHRCWQEIRRQRAERWLVAQACAEVADRMAREVSQGLERVLAQADVLWDNVESHLTARLDAQHPIARSFEQLRAAAHNTVKRCAESRNGTLNSSGYGPVPLESLVREVLSELYPGFISKMLTLQEPASTPYSVHTFSHDIKDVVREIVFSAVEAAPKKGRVQILVGVGGSRRTVEVTVIDEGPPFDDKLCSQISGARPVKQEEPRAWGLSLAQRVARNIGAQIDPTRTEAGNAVTLRIPVTRDDEPTGRR